MIYLHVAKEAYSKFEISNVGLISSAENIAACSTKSVKVNRLLQVIENGQDNVVFNEWIDRKGNNFWIAVGGLWDIST